MYSTIERSALICKWINGNAAKPINGTALFGPRVSTCNESIIPALDTHSEKADERFESLVEYAGIDERAVMVKAWPAHAAVAAVACSKRLDGSVAVVEKATDWISARVTFEYLRCCGRVSVPLGPSPKRKTRLVPSR